MGRTSFIPSIQCMELDPTLPAVMQIRHSERPTVNVNEGGLNTPLSDRGEKAAHQFGSKLPVDRHYHFYHTDIERTKMTAERIQQGVVDNDGVSKIVGEIPVSSINDTAAFRELMREIGGEDAVARFRTFFYRWVYGFYPPWWMTPSLEFAQQGASFMMRNLWDSDMRDMHIWVSHELWVAAFLLHWLGEYSFDWVSFMDGFILQFKEENMTFYFRGETKEVKYPHWWSF